MLHSNPFNSCSFFFADADAPMLEVPLALTPPLPITPNPHSPSSQSVGEAIMSDVTVNSTTVRYMPIAPSAQQHGVPQEDTQMGDDFISPNMSRSLVPSPHRENLPSDENPEVPKVFHHDTLALVTYSWGSGIVMQLDLSKVFKTSHFALVGFHCLSLDRSLG
jgi:hypothetical protein